MGILKKHFLFKEKKLNLHPLTRLFHKRLMLRELGKAERNLLVLIIKNIKQ